MRRQGWIAGALVALVLGVLAPPAVAGTPPTVSFDSITGVGATVATFTGHVNGHQDVGTLEWQFQWCKVAECGDPAKVQESPGSSWPASRTPPSSSATPAPTRPTCSSPAPGPAPGVGRGARLDGEDRADGALARRAEDPRVGRARRVLDVATFRTAKPRKLGKPRRLAAVRHGRRLLVRCGLTGMARRAEILVRYPDGRRELRFPKGARLTLTGAASRASRVTVRAIGPDGKRGPAATAKVRRR